MRFVLSSVALLAIAGIVLLSCSSSPTKPTPEPFSLHIIVQDSTGQPVPGLQVSAWNDTVHSYTWFAPAVPSGDHVPGDVDCDGKPYQWADYWLVDKYMTSGPRAVGDTLTCLLRNANVVPATPGVTLTDFVYFYNKMRKGPLCNPLFLQTVPGTFKYEDSSRTLEIQGTDISWIYAVCEGSEPRWTNDCFYAFSGYDSTFTYTLYHYNIDSYSGPCSGPWNGGVLAVLPGKLVSLQATKHDGTPFQLTRQAHQTYVYMKIPNPSDSQLFIYLQTYMRRPMSLVFKDMGGHKVDSLYVPSAPSWGTTTWTPPTPVPRIYQIIMSVYESPGLTSYDTTYGAIWSERPDFNLLGTTNTSGQVSSTDGLRFVGFWRDTLWQTEDRGGYPAHLMSLRFSDSLTVSVRDTSSDLEKRTRYGMTRGENNIKITWP